MNNKDNLIGKVITVFLSGGWELSGEVKSLDDNKFIIENNEDLLMVFKDKISCLIISKDARVLRPPEFGSRSVSPNLPVEKAGETADDLFPMNGMAYDESGMSIPRGLLSKEAEMEDDDLSVFFQGGHGISGDASQNEDRIEFEIEDDSTDKD